MQPSDHVVTIHQPQYLPFVGTLAKISKADSYVIYDTADYQKGYFDNRNRITTKNGQVWITIPVSARLGQQIRDVKVAGSSWKKKHLKTISQVYGRSVFFDMYYPDFEKMLSVSSEWLMDFVEPTLIFLIEAFGIDVTVKRASEIDGLKEPTSARELIRLTQAMNGTAYLAGPSWFAYMTNEDVSSFKRAGIEFLEIQYTPFQYASCAVFAENMSAIDMLFSLGPCCRNTLNESSNVEIVNV